MTLTWPSNCVRIVIQESTTPPLVKLHNPIIYQYFAMGAQANVLLIANSLLPKVDTALNILKCVCKGSPGVAW